MDEILENVIIDSWAKHFRRSPNQINKLHEADVELVEMSADLDFLLAATVDTVAEEILVGLYREGRTMGWVAISASLSDLAAVGAEPLGIVISASVNAGRSEPLVAQIARGMEEACRSHGVFILGGDTNATPDTSLTSCALGLVPRNKYMTRIGCKPGDIVFATGRMGMGNGLGFVRLTGCPAVLFPEADYRPKARLKEGQLIRDYASCCMDTSDGLFTTLDQLMRLNGLGFLVNCDWEKLVTPEIFTLCAKTQTPPWAMLAGPHGEFELVFTVPPDRMIAFNERAEKEDLNPLRIGEVQQQSQLTLLLPSSKKVEIDMSVLRNLLQNVSGDLKKYVTEFLAYGRERGLH
ncbi:MAG: thiamine-monophosphate kinase [candidate division WOR-3 bacterium]|nr:MAG: thiamine-monophosphate kinase [candidate division WOR-3 bacterium]